MLRIEQIEDKHTLRQAAILLERENQRLHDKLRDLAEEIARLKGEDASAVQLQLEFSSVPTFTRGWLVNQGMEGTYP